MRVIVLIVEVLLFLGFVGTNAFYLWTALMALGKLPRFMKRHLANPVRRRDSRFELPVSVIVPAYNESEGIVATVRSLLAFTYSAFEIIVVNDGSTDDTLALLEREFSLRRSTEPYRVAIRTTSIRGIYRSHAYPNLRVVDKPNGGKSDALNVGTNCARYPLVFTVDADSFYVPETLACMVEPFLSDRRTVVTAASIGIANGCEFKEGRLERVRLSGNPLVQFQVLEYLRAFLCSRLGWAPINALGIVSGACGLYRRDIVLQVGGFRTDTIWEDMEMTVRVHHYMRSRKQPYRVAYTPFPVCWTMVPDTISALWKQRVGWHRHISETMSIHRKLLFARGGGTIAWIGLPYLIFCEWLAPLAVVMGFVFCGIAVGAGFLSFTWQYVLLLLVGALSLVVTMAALLLDELSFDSYRLRDVASLLVAATVEFFGFRQLLTLAHFTGMCAWAFRRRVRGRRMAGITVRPYDPARSPDWRGDSVATVGGTTWVVSDQRRVPSPPI